MELLHVNEFCEVANRYKLHLFSLEQKGLLAFKGYELLEKLTE
jgi:hypothetical protein